MEEEKYKKAVEEVRTSIMNIIKLLQNGAESLVAQDDNIPVRLVECLISLEIAGMTIEQCKNLIDDIENSL